MMLGLTIRVITADMAINNTVRCINRRRLFPLGFLRNLKSIPVPPRLPEASAAGPWVIAREYSLLRLPWRINFQRAATGSGNED